MSIALRHPAMHQLAPKLLSNVRLTQADVGAMRTPDAHDVDAVLGWLSEAGITQTRPDKDWVHVRTTVAKAEKLLKMQLHRYSFDNKPAVVRTREYSVPDHLAKVVSFVHPIANFMTPEHEVAASSRVPGEQLPHARDEDVCRYGIQPLCIMRQYNISYTAPTGASPSRLGIAGFLEEYANFDDLQNFFGRYVPHLAGYTFGVELVNGGQNPQNASKAGTEANLDVEYALAIGHPARATYYSTGGRGVKLNDSGQPFPDEYTDNEPYLDLLEYLLGKPDEELPHVLSVSYADDELSVPRPYAEKTCCLFGLLAGRGVSVIFGSGDGGARGGRNATCRTNDGTNRDVTIATFPPSCPWVTAVGAVTSDDDPPRGATFSSGGFSQYFERPGWQAAAVDEYVEALDGHLAGYYNASMRALPDISAVGERFLTVVGGNVTMLSGTSASAPVFAAMIALINDARLRRGQRSLGWLNERLYSIKVRAMLRDKRRGQSKSCVFSGGLQPGGWRAKKGWDAVTGLGTPGAFDDLLRVLGED